MRGQMTWALIAGLLILVATPAFADAPVANPDGAANAAPVTRVRVAVTPSQRDVVRAVGVAETRTEMVRVDTGTVSTTTRSGETLCFPQTKPYGQYDRCGAAKCATCGPCPNCEKPRGYGGILVSAYPGLGFGMEFGKFICITECTKLSWEINLNYQDMYDHFNNIELGQNGKWMGARAGLKMSFFAQSRFHPTLRAGLGWNVATADTANDFNFGTIERPEGRGVNYFGGYVGVGVEWDFCMWGEKFTTGPEFWGFVGYGDYGSDSYALTGTLAWHLILNL